MRDQEILALLDGHDEAAITALQQTYGAYCRAIAESILDRPEDCEECLNDLWHRAWTALPENHPRQLRLYLAARSMTWLMRSTLEAKVVTMMRLSQSLNSLSSRS